MLTTHVLPTRTTEPVRVDRKPVADAPKPFGSVEALDLRQLDAHTEFVVETQNSEYHFVLLDRENWQVLVQGGRAFPSVASARIEGAELDPHLFSVGWVRTGCAMALAADVRIVLTSPVKGIYVSRASAIAA